MAQLTEAPPNVPVIPRKEFVREFARNYGAGQHVTFIGPSGRGKSKLMGQLLLAVLRVHTAIKALILHGKIKGRDQTIMDLSKAANLPMIEHYPPNTYEKHIRYRKHRGWTLRPLVKGGESVKHENALLHREFKKGIHRSYNSSRKHPCILVVDEAHQAHNDLKLKTECEGPLMRGRPVCGVWSLIQRGRFVSYMCYDQAEHVFIFYDPDEDNRRRYSEIGGIDPLLVRELASRLKTRTVADGSTISQCLYFRRSGNYLCIVDT